MSITKNKLQLRGAKNKAVGAIKEKVGKAVGNSKLEAKGTGERAKGQIQIALGNMKSAAKSGLKRVNESIGKG